MLPVLACPLPDAGEKWLYPVQTETTATCTMASKDGGGHEITNMRLHVRCEVPDIDEATFNQLVMAADQGCPVSNLLRSGLKIEITTDQPEMLIILRFLEFNPQ